MGCMFLGGLTSRATRPLQMHVVVERPLAHGGTGRVSCLPFFGQDPIRFEWSPRHGMTLDATGSEASDVPAGRYRVIATDATQAILLHR